MTTFQINSTRQNTIDSVAPARALRLVIVIALAVQLFAATLSFLFTTPGVFDESVGGIPLRSVSGGFLIKDVALLGISAWALADALRPTRSSLAGSSQPHAT
jgi:uncharacterized membrane protein YkgB